MESDCTKSGRCSGLEKDEMKKERGDVIGLLRGAMQRCQESIKLPWGEKETPSPRPTDTLHGCSHACKNRSVDGYIAPKQGACPGCSWRWFWPWSGWVDKREREDTDRMRNLTNHLAIKMNKGTMLWLTHND